MYALFGLPSHPLLVHIPVVLVPLGALGAIAIVARPGWRVRYGALVAIVILIGAAGAVLAAHTGEELQRQVPRSATLHDHVQAGDLARLAAVLFAGAAVAHVGFDWWLRTKAARDGGAAVAPHPLVAHRRIISAVLGTALLLTAVAAAGAMVWAGHLGAKATWGTLPRR